MDASALPLPQSDPGSPSQRRGDRSVSIAQVARRAGVSVATVSRVLNGKQVVRPSTRDRVRDAIEATGYRVNVLARNLRRDESRLLLALVPDIGNPFYAQIVQGIDAIMQAEGYALMLCETAADTDRERRYLDLLDTRRADGAICMDADTVQQAMAGRRSALPWVACCEYDAGMAVPYVGIDNAAAARDAVTHLLGKGHERIALLNSDLRFMYARERQRGYRLALEAAGLPWRDDYCAVADGLDFQAGRRAARHFMDLKRPPTAIFAVSDTLAIGVMRGLCDLGRRVPTDVAVMGFDDIALAAQCCPALTTVAQPMRDLGRHAARLLLDRLADPARRPTGLVLPHAVVQRESA